MTPKKLAKIIGDTHWQQWIKKRARKRCELCGETNQQLHAHHIEGKASMYMRVNEDNGVCLCSNCHRTIHAVGNNGNFTDQWGRLLNLREYLGEDRIEKLKRQRHQAKKLDLSDLKKIREELKSKLK